MSARAIRFPTGAAPFAIGSAGSPGALRLTGRDAPKHIINALALEAYLDGSQPHARSVELEDVVDVASVLPADARIVRTHHSADGNGCWLARGTGWTAQAERIRAAERHLVRITVTAVAEETAERVVRDIVDATRTNRSDPSDVEIGFWHLGDRGTARRSTRSLPAQPWQNIRGNYTASVASRFGELASLAPDDLFGSILVMHGPPGTGKTTALRSLAYAWQSWCAFEYVLDQEKILASADYLAEVAFGSAAHESGRPGRPWRMIVIEDGDALIRADGGRASGAQLSRLLNITDGMLGAGRRVLVAITTNEDLHRVHPAITRPGRCLAEIEFGLLSAAEADTWAERNPGGPTTSASGPTSLAELYAQRAGANPARERLGRQAVGAYL
ncbi:DUF5925 domain-containing protein [Streptomyces sp. IBSNAI002]|uniref:DUF5925 domain-containing protein n=1 Tax=Streptomyces sp. IBSNAI002 TaxID=3457500 RepID=UPI003FD1463E